MVLILFLTSEELFKILSPGFHSKKSLSNFPILCSWILKLSLQLQVIVMCRHWGPLTQSCVPSCLPIQEATVGEHLTFPEVQSIAGGTHPATSCHMVTQFWLKLLLASAGVTKPFWVGVFRSFRNKESSNIWLTPVTSVSAPFFIFCLKLELGSVIEFTTKSSYFIHLPAHWIDCFLSWYNVIYESKNFFSSHHSAQHTIDFQ